MDQPKSAELEAAFRTFTQMSRRLEDSYRDLEGRVQQLTGELETARRERQKQSRERKRLSGRLQGLLEALPAGVVVLDGRGYIREFNPGAVELLGEPLEDQKWQTVTKRAFATTQNADGDIALANGRRINISRRALTEETGWILLLSDVTESRAIQELLDRHKRLSAMGEMAAGLAHQIRTPLAAALLYASQFTSSAATDDERQRFADKTVSRLRHLERMVNDMLTFAKGGATASDMLPVRDVVSEVAAGLEPQLTDGACLLVKDIPEQLIIQGNREALVGAIMNVATNALQAAGSGACLEIEVRPATPGEVDILVGDNGPGIAPDLKERIFEPFFTTRPDGTGLGLAVVKSVARAHGGSVTVDTQPDRGTTVGLRLPLAGGLAVLRRDLPVRSGGFCKDSGWPAVDGNAARTVDPLEDFHS